MGGVKKKPISAMEKRQVVLQQKEEKKKKEEETQAAKGARAPASVSEEDVLKVVSSLKAVTIYTIANKLNIKASVANQILKSLVQKGKIEKVGGFSGHYVYAIKSA